MILVSFDKFILETILNYYIIHDDACHMFLLK